eukprot:scaffold121551_cov39-Attheya_sp.AAC.1
MLAEEEWMRLFSLNITRNILFARRVEKKRGLTWQCRLAVPPLWRFDSFVCCNKRRATARQLVIVWGLP